MTDKKKTLRGQTYRLSDVFIKKWTRILLTILIGGLGGGLLLMLFTIIVYGNIPTDELPTWLPPTMIGLMAAGLVIPLVLGAILGGLAIHRFAWIPLLLVVGGLLTAGVSSVDGLKFLEPYSFVAMALGVISIFIIAIAFTNVPIWLQFPIVRSPRFYLRGKNKHKK